MLISVSIENWASLREKTTFSMLASREKQHGERLTRSEKYNMRVLPIAAIYGGNASGKTNFFKAINFAKNFVVRGTQPQASINVNPYRLDSKCIKEPSRFVFQIFIDETIYELSFSVTRNEVVEESLVEVRSASERVLYHRKNGKPHFHKSLKKDKFLEFAFRGTRDNQLFLTNCVQQKVEKFLPIYNWFKDQLVLIAPDARFAPFELFIEEDNPMYAVMNETLASLDTGIEHLGGDPIPFEDLPCPAGMKSQLQEEVEEGSTVYLFAPNNDRYLVTRKNNEMEAKKLVAYHCDGNGREVKFEIRNESDGSLRAIDLLPAFVEMFSGSEPKVYIIDEIDRSLHSLLTRELLEAYLLEAGGDKSTQLLFTTHDVLLMDQSLLRRDEMWISERDRTGNTSLRSFSEYEDVRYDKDIRKSYLQGRMGGIPRILLSGSLIDKELQKTNESLVHE